MRLGLRVDVDTHEGMRDGVPAIRETLGRHGFVGSFFFSFGPDRSGLAVLRAFRKPGFVAKMLRTNAVSMYGVRTALSGTLLPSRPIALAFPELARACRASGHEVGLHAWDHVAWQDHLPEWSIERAREELVKGATAFGEVFGSVPRCAAAPAWMATASSLRAQDALELDYATDCRCESPEDEGPFLPIYGGDEFQTPQIAASLPTLDECLGREGFDLDRVAELWLAAADRGTAVATIHAEAEGRAYREWFDHLCARLRERGGSFVPLGTLVTEALLPLPRRTLELREIPGRAGPVAAVAHAVGARG